MDLKIVAVAYFVGLALFAIAAGFLDWRLGVGSLGLGLMAPAIALPGGDE